MGSRYPSSDFENYTRKIKDYSLLTPEEELDLARRYRQGDIEAGKKIITSNLRFVVKIAQPYFHLGYGPLEIVQEGNMGLVKALTRFDPDMGVRFICYAIWWIKAYIKNFIHKSYQVHTGRLTHAKGLVSDSTIPERHRPRGEPSGPSPLRGPGSGRLLFLQGETRLSPESPPLRPPHPEQAGGLHHRKEVLQRPPGNAQGHSGSDRGDQGEGPADRDAFAPEDPGGHREATFDPGRGPAYRP